MSRSASKSVPTLLLVFLLIALCLVLIAALPPAGPALAHPPLQATTPPKPPGERPNPPGIPEPATIMLVGLGIGALAGYAWRLRKTHEKPPEA
jgi:hypothetical protein